MWNCIGMGQCRSNCAQHDVLGFDMSSVTDFRFVALDVSKHWECDLRLLPNTCTLSIFMSKVLSQQQHGQFELQNKRLKHARCATNGKTVSEELVELGMAVEAQTGTTIVMLTRLRKMAALEVMAS